MNPTCFTIRLKVQEVRRIGENQARVWASSGLDTLSFKTEIPENGMLTVNDEILVTVVAPATGGAS